MNISVVILKIEPPANAQLLDNTLQSLREQGLTHKDEVILVLKQNDVPATDAWRKAGLSGILIRTDESQFGAAGQRRAASANHVILVRDGDVFTPGAINHIRTVISSGPIAVDWHFETDLSLLDGPIADLFCHVPIAIAPPRDFARDTSFTVLHKFYIKDR